MNNAKISDEQVNNTIPGWWVYNKPDNKLGLSCVKLSLA